MPSWPEDKISVDAYPGPGYDLTIFYNDLDTNWHLNNVALGRFFEQGRFRNNSDAGMRDVQSGTGSHFLVGRVAIDYVSEGTYDGGPLHVRTRTGRIGTSSVVLEQAAWQGDRVVGLCETTLVHLVDGRPAPLGDALRTAFEAMRV
jgi:acyl-CoA thioester hydrolase